MDKVTIAVVEDEPEVLETIIYNFELEGFEVTSARSGEAGLALIHDQLPSLVILDLMLPGLDGYSVCQQLKSDPDTADIPIIIVSAKSEESDIVIGLGMGADDYLPKPFSPRELLARAKAVLRRCSPQTTWQQERNTVGPLEIDLATHEITVDGKPLKLTVTEFTILYQLASQPGRTLTREQLLRALGSVVVARNIDVHVRAIRKKLGARRRLIETVRGVGYRLAEN